MANTADYIWEVILRYVEGSTTTDFPLPFIVAGATAGARQANAEAAARDQCQKLIAGGTLTVLSSSQIGTR